MPRESMFQGSASSVPALVKLMREDWVTHGRSFSAPGFQALAIHRFGVWIRLQEPVTRHVLSLLHRALYVLVRTAYGVELPASATIGRRVYLPHPVGTIISGEARIGDDCWIRQGVTIGRFNRGRDRPPPYAPTIGAGVEVGAGAVLVGGITIGDGARIGPNAVVMADVPAGASAFAAPAKIIGPLLRDVRPAQGEAQR
jgi:serine O-acetyltransferase